MQFPAVFRPLFGDVLWRVKTAEKKIYLTFDDGPVPEVTPAVLEILKRYSWKATFFCVGENVFRYPALYQQIITEGHQTGNHTFNHIRGWDHDLKTYVDNVEKASEFIHSKLFRPPHGRISFRQLRVLRRKYRIVMWDVITADYDARKTPEEVMNTVKSNIRPGSVVVFHDSLKARDRVLSVLPQAIEFWESEGYSWGLL
jgi:peptidoglycan/xylan/chitin deacetylase (PgdA/CDA1 family)